MDEFSVNLLFRRHFVSSPNHRVFELLFVVADDVRSHGRIISRFNPDADLFKAVKDVPVQIEVEGVGHLHVTPFHGVQRLLNLVVQPRLMVAIQKIALAVVDGEVALGVDVGKSRCESGRKVVFESVKGGGEAEHDAR